MSKRESALQKECLEYLQSQNIYVLNAHGSSYMTKGTPDLISCIRGRFVAFELKVKNNQLEPAQRIIRDRIKNSGGFHYEIRNLDDFKLIVERLLCQ